MSFKRIFEHPRDKAQQQYTSARNELLLVIILTAVNMILFFCGSGTMFLFSATVPYLITIFGTLSGVWTLAGIAVFLSAVILAAYLVCYLLSKKHYAFMIVALVLFSIDTTVMIFFYILMQGISGIMDAIIHFLLLGFLINGVVQGYKLKTLPSDDGGSSASLSEAVTAQIIANESGIPVEAAQTMIKEAREAEAEAGTSDVPSEEAKAFLHSVPLRPEDRDAKHRVLLTCNYSGHTILYRRVKRTNELIIDGQVYDEHVALLEFSHMLFANVYGHTFSAGFDGTFSFICVDDDVLAKKMRLI